MVKQFQLHAGLCFLDKTQSGKPEENITNYNQKVDQAIQWLSSDKNTFIIREEKNIDNSYVLIEEGKFYGMGLISSFHNNENIQEIKSKLTPYPSNEMIESMINKFVEKYPQKVLNIPLK